MKFRVLRLEFGAFAAFRSWFRANVANDIVSASNGAVGAVCIAREKEKRASGKALSRELIMKYVSRNFTGRILQTVIRKIPHIPPPQIRQISVECIHSTLNLKFKPSGAYRSAEALVGAV